jgi:serine/threonine-protein kinase
VVVFYELFADTGRDLMRLTLADRRAEPLLRTRFEERNAEVSPTGGWVAYESDMSGRFEVYVRPFPDVNGGRWQISAGGGNRPLWAPDGDELFYLGADGALMRVAVDAGGESWNASNPERLLPSRYFTSGGIARTYDVSRDGGRFLMIKQTGRDQNGPPPQIVVVQDWLEELRRLAPTN